MLNLGCGVKTAPDWVNVDWSPYLRLRASPALRRVAAVALSGERRRRFERLDPAVLVHDLRRPLPFADGTVDAVYHSHLFEHLDRDRVGGFLAEVRRVLRPGGRHRVCVPDLEQLARAYLASLEAARAAGPRGWDRHDASVAELYEQSVRKDAWATAGRRGAAAAAERVVLGDARRRGETHQWMYDEVNLGAVLAEAGFVDVRRRAWNDSAIPGWMASGLEVGDGGEYRPGSLYLECRAPS